MSFGNYLDDIWLGSLPWSDTASVIHSRGCLSGNHSAKIPELKSSRCLILWTVQGNAMVNRWDFLLQKVINCSRSSLRTPAILYMVHWQPFTSFQIYSHATACCILFLLLPVLRMISKCAARVISLEAALAASRWTNWGLRSCCVPMSDVFDLTPGNLRESDPLSPGWGGCVSIICWCWIEEEQDNGKKWEVLRTI